MGNKPQESNWKELVKQLNTILEKPDDDLQTEKLTEALRNESPTDIALGLEELKTEQVATVFDVLEKKVAEEVLAKLEPECQKDLLAKLDSDKWHDLIETLQPRDKASVLAEVPKQKLNNFLRVERPNTATVKDVKQRLNYPKGTAGRLMTTEYVRLNKEWSVQQALEAVRQTDPKVDIPEDLYVVEKETTDKIVKSRLLGVISIRELLMCDPNKLVNEVMSTEVVSIAASVNETDAAALFSKYKYMAMPVTDDDDNLVGVIPADDLIPFIIGRLRRLYTQAVGTDTETMEKLSPLQAARLRVPWLVATMVVELGAGLIISHFDAVLQKIILLASFMPVISAVSGNVGLQAAAITVRALDTKSGGRKNVWGALKKEGATSFLMALTCGLILGTVGAIWSKHLPFGLVIGIAMMCSMLTAGFMGTVIPMLSKQLGFDPATTAGPFETAFQDIVGFAVFLGLATVLQHWMT